MPMFRTNDGRSLQVGARPYGGGLRPEVSIDAIYNGSTSIVLSSSFHLLVNEKLFARSVGC